MAAENSDNCLTDIDIEVMENDIMCPCRDTVLTDYSSIHYINHNIRKNEPI